MRLERLQLRGLRSLTEVSLDFGAGLNVIVGANGAGKTSILEAVFLLSHGRSFRAGAREALIQRGEAAMSIYSEWQLADGTIHRLGLGRQGQRWQARIDGANAPLSELVSRCAVVCFEPGSHALIAGAAEERRQYLDWGVFHVEPLFLPAWRRYQRALKQRNSLIRAGSPFDEAAFLPWEAELARSGLLIDGYRRKYVAALLPLLRDHTQRLLPELGDLEFRYRSGWTQDIELADVLAMHRARDIARGHTTAGPHRGDWSMGFDKAPLREHLSRGQEKLVALACLMTQASLFAQLRGEWPLICLDDLASELDAIHQQAVVAALVAANTQVLITGTEVPATLTSEGNRLFHVEQGRVAPLL